MRRLSLVCALVCALSATCVALPLFGEVRRAKEPVAGQYIVTFRPSVTDVEVATRELAAQHGGTVLAVWRHALRGAALAMSESAALEVARDARVASVAEDAVIHASGCDPVSGNHCQATGTDSHLIDPLRAESVSTEDDPLWHLTQIANRKDAISVTGVTGDPEFRYAAPFDGAGVMVYVIDSGVVVSHAAADHESGFDSGSFVAKVNEKDSDQPVSEHFTLFDPLVNADVSDPIPLDESGALDPCGGSSVIGNLHPMARHGTAVAGFVVGKKTGVAKGAQVVPVKIVSCGGAVPFRSAAMLISGLDWVYQHAVPPAVVSLSHFQPLENAEPSCKDCIGGFELEALETVISNVIDKGIPVVVSANNLGGDACKTSPPNFSRRAGRNPGVISVGGLNRDGTIWSESNRGQCVDIWAPATNLTVIAAADKTDVEGRPLTYIPSGDTAHASGTSYAAPMVAGVIARLLQEDPSLWAPPREQIAERVWNRLAANATVLENPLGDVSSPRLRLYLGGVTFEQEPRVESGQLTVKAYDDPADPNDDVTYTWHRTECEGTECEGTGPSIAATPGTYVVKIQRQIDGVTYTAESNPITVPAADASMPPRFISGPTTQWVTGDALASLKVALSSAGQVRWWKYSASGRAPVTDCVSDADPQTLLPCPTELVETYSAEADACSGCAVVQSDTAQIRRCTPIPRLALVHATDEYDAYTDLNVALTSPIPTTPTVSLLWLYSPAENGLLTPVDDPDDENNPDDEIGEFARKRTLAPQKPGWYSLRVANECDRYVTNQVPIRKTCHHFAIPTISGGGQITTGDARVPIGTSAMLAVSVGNTKHALAYEWTLDDGKVFFTPTISQTVTDRMTITIKVTDTVSRCEKVTTFTLTPCDMTLAAVGPTVVSGKGGLLTLYVDETPDRCMIWVPEEAEDWVSISRVPADTSRDGSFDIKVEPNLLPVSRRATISVRVANTLKRTIEITQSASSSCPGDERSFYAIGGRCGVQEPKYSARPGTLLPLAPVLKGLDGNLILPADAATDFDFEWTGGGLQSSDRAVDFTVPSTRTELTVKVTRRANPCDFDVMKIIIEPCESCPVLSCRRRAVRSLNVPTFAVTFTPGQTLKLQPPDDEPAVSYEWHRSTSAVADETFSTSANVSDTPIGDTRYWVVTNYGTHIEESAELRAVDESNLPRVAATPRLSVLPAGGTVTLDVRIPAGYQATDYEWHMGDPSDPNAVVVGRGSRLVRSNVTEDASFWCNVTEAGADTPDITNIADVIATCNDSIAGTVTAFPNNGYISRSDRAFVQTSAIGKNATYEWYAQVPGQSAYLIAPYGKSTWISPSQPVTYYSVVVSDSCGNTATLGNTPVYLCLPTIERQPADTVAPPQSPVVLNLEASPAIAGQEIKVFWYAGGDPYQQNPLHEGPVFATTSPAAGMSQTYYATVVATNACGGVPRGIRSADVTVTSCTPPQVSVSPSAPSIRAGTSLTLTVSATSTNLTYQWYVEAPGSTASPIEGATDSYVTVMPLTNTSYWVRVTSDGVCTTDSAEIRVNVCTDPVITAQPAPATIVPGATATLSVATSAAGVTYQWYDAGTADPIPGATSATLSVSPTVDTSYYVRIKRDACTVQSNTVRVTVCALTANLTGGKNTAYQEWVTLTVTPSNARVPATNAHYTWYKGTGANATVFNSGTGMTQRSDNPATTTQYWVRVNDGTCTYDSNVVAVNVCVPTITLQPQGTLIQPNQTATLSVSTTNIAGQTFQWYIGQPGDTSQPAPGTSATSATYTTPALASTTSYWVRVSGPCDAVRNSEAAIVSVCAPATVSSVTPTRSIKAGTATILQVSATGSNLTYQWFAGTPGTTTNPIEGATADSVTVSPTTTTTYWARIWTDGLCTKDSPAILVDVCTDPLISTHPSPVTIRSGSPATLSVASPASGVTYQWYDANTADPIAGATNPTLVVTPVADARYYARIKRNVCTVQSNTAQVTVCALTVNLTGGKNTTYQEWVTLTATPANSRVPSANAHYTWYKGTGANATVFNSGTGLTQRSDNPATTTQYWVRVTDGTCTYDSNVVTVNVCVPTIATQPQGTLIQPNQTATLSVSTTTIAGQTYRWYIGARGDTSQPAPGTSATSSTYITPALTSTTTYWVRVTGPCGAIADSAVATVSVCTPATIGSVTPTRYVKAGTTTWHQVYATGSNLTYQWYIGSPGNTTNPIPDATTNSISVTPTTTTTYWARIWTDGLCTKDSPAMIVDVCTNPVVTTQPASTSVKSGQSATLSVATSTAGVTYQWYSVSGTLINGATGSSLTVTPTTDTAYYCQLTKNACSINSATATVKVCTLTAAISGGTNATSGQNVLLTASATNLRVTADAATYTWYRGTGPSATVLASGVGLRQRYVSTTTTTDYWVRITDGTCTADSNTTRVNVCIPTITAHPQGANITRGQSVTLSVSATAASSYQWYVGSAGDTSQPVAGATTASMTVTPTATTTYWARVTGCSSVDSIAATIDVCQPPTITAGPSENGVRSPGAWAAIWVTASGANLSYQWYIGQSGDTSMPITAATTDRYDFIAKDSRYYWVRITGSCGTVNSATVLHSVNPKIVQHPANTTVPPNATVTLSVSATGTYLAYQWYRGNTFDVSNPVSGATSSSFTTPPVTGTTNYWCRVTSATQGVANSYHATVGLCTGPSITRFRAQYQYSNYWWISVTMAEADIGNVDYHWYTGVPGNVSQSVYQGEANGYKQVLATAQQTWWCRVWYNDQSCYTDTNGATIYPVE